MALSTYMFLRVNPENLKLSIYDPIKKVIVLLKVVIKNGYIYFKTPVGGTIIATS